VADYSLANMGALQGGRALDANLALFSGSLSRLGLIIMLVTPLSTMRAFAPSSAGGHLDLLLSFPLGRFELVLGHYLSAFLSISLLALLALLPYLILMAAGVGSVGVLLCSLLGFLLLISAFVGLGLAVSSLCRAQLPSALSTLGLLALLWALGWAAPFLPELPASLAQGLAFAPRLSHFTLGLLDLNDLLFFLCLTLAGLILAKPAP
jgi:ABC-2 type transport system permease protein